MVSCATHAHTYWQVWTLLGRQTWLRMACSYLCWITATCSRGTDPTPYVTRMLGTLSLNGRKVLNCFHGDYKSVCAYVIQSCQMFESCGAY